MSFLKNNRFLIIENYFLILNHPNVRRCWKTVNEEETIKHYETTISLQIKRNLK